MEPPRRPCARPVGPGEDRPLLECAPQPRLGSQPKSCPPSLLCLGRDPGLRGHEGGSSFSAVGTSRPPLLGSVSALQSGVVSRAHVALSLCGFLRGCAGLLFIPGHRGHLRSRLPIAAASCCESSRCSPVASGVAVPGPLPGAGVCCVLTPVPVSVAALRFGAQSGLSLELCALDVCQSRACDSEPCQLLNQGNVSLHSVYGKRLPASPWARVLGV